MPEYVYTRDSFEGHYNVDHRSIGATLSKEVESTFPGEGFRLRKSGSEVKFIFDSAVSNETTLSQKVTDHKNATAAAWLIKYKEEKTVAIDSRTVELINQGFIVSGKVFSLSQEAQNYWNGLGNLTSNGLIQDHDEELSDPPITPIVNRRYLVSAPATGSWVGEEGRIAVWDGSQWNFSEADFPLRVNTLDDLDTHDIQNIAEAITFFATAASTVKTHLASGTALKDQVRAAIDKAGVDAVVDNR